ncbi:hypothetical protein, partial [Neisseria meningitidis]|uniref:hypothetical protein n=1 Tax=Neisseria meningitidis TaxID=487 RepID=UPI001C5A47C3
MAYFKTVIFALAALVAVAFAAEAEDKQRDERGIAYTGLGYSGYPYAAGLGYSGYTGYPYARAAYHHQPYSYGAYPSYTSYNYGAYPY